MKKVPKKEVVRIHFMDGSVRGFGIEEETTSLQLKEIISEKLDLKENRTFSLFEKKGATQRPLANEERVTVVMHSWSENDSQEPSSDPNRNSIRKDPPCFMFRKAVFFRNEVFTDPVARNLMYIQVLASIVDSLFPSSIDESIHLAGIQFQAIYGDHKPEIHQSGFIEDKIKEYIPKNLLKEKKTKDWEALILKAHQKFTGLSTENAESAYINYVKQSIIYYGTEFFSCKNAATKKLPDKVLLGVNAEGLIILKKDQELLCTFHWAELASWSGTQEKQFTFELVNRDQQPSKFILECSQSKTISKLITFYVDHILSQTFQSLYHQK